MTNVEISKIVPGWSFLARTGNSKMLHEVAKYFILAPIIARLLLKFAKELVGVKGFDFVARLTLPHDWQLLYYSAFCFLVAGICYEVRAPRIFKDYASYFLYARSSPEVGEVLEYFLEVANGSSRSRAALGELLRQSEDPRAPLEMGDEVESVELEDILRAAPFEERSIGVRRSIWLFCDGGRTMARIICLGFYSLGFSLVAMAFLSDLSIVIEQSQRTQLLNHIRHMLIR